MHFLIDACLPRDIAQVLDSFGHAATDVRNIGMGSADDLQVAAFALSNRLCLLSEDWGFADVRQYPPSNYHGIVVFETSQNSVDQTLDAVRNLLKHEDVVRSLSGRLAIVTPTRIRLRPPI